MNYLRGALNAASQYYRDINPSTLTGAIDVIVVRRTVPGVDEAEGSAVELACSPFHARFGKWQVLRPVDKKVKVMVNGSEIPFYMKIGDAGEAFFVFETDDDIPEDLITSPILEATRPGEGNGNADIEADRFGAKVEDEDGNELLRPDSGNQLGEPDLLELDSPLAGATDSTPGPSQLIATSAPHVPPSSSPESKPQESEKSQEDQASPNMTGLVSRTADLGKAVAKAALEAERYEGQQIRGKADAVENAAGHAYETFNRGIFGAGEGDKGDEALPPVREGEGEPPEVIYSHNMVVDASGYHTKNEPQAEQNENRQVSRRGSFSSDSYEGRSTPNDDAEAERDSSGSPMRKKRFAKTLRLTSDQLKQLNLKSGKNLITFSLSTSGVTACTASIFLWEETDSIVVSDIDGTITKSDALGHVFTMIGRDWTHLGVAKLYTDIARNGYNIVYLTSRAIGQADSTRYYLKSINQNNYQLPEGPVVMSPDRLMASFHREVIMRKPEVFKMACLRDIQRLFGDGKSPFYAGFGNRITDALSYRSVNIPSQRIFTIDSTGEVKMELLEVAGYKSSYIHLTDLVDQMFPPVHRKTETEFSDMNYWKLPIQDIPLPDLTPPPSSPALSARSDASTLTFSRLRNFSLRQSTSSFFQVSATPTEPDGREVTPRERLTKLHMRSSETLVEHAWSDDERGRRMGARSGVLSNETSRERRARKRRSWDSMPGSLDGSEADFETDEEEEGEGYDREDEDRHGDDEEAYEDHYDAGPEDPEEAAEEGFDDDLLATGEMESVPYL